MVDTLFTNGVIAVKEKLLLGDKLLRLTEMNAEDALRALVESGFGSGAEQADGESLCKAEEKLLDEFIREYAPTDAEKIYLLAPRDFHNAKAVCKAQRTGEDAENMLAPEGCIPVSLILKGVVEGEYRLLGNELGSAVKTVMESENITGAEIGAIFDSALFNRLYGGCKRNKTLKTLIIERADMTNILTAMRSSSLEKAEKLFVGGGRLKVGRLAAVFDDNIERAEKALENTEYAEFYKLCFAAKQKRLPLTEAERALESFEAEYFARRRFELVKSEPFLYYVFRRRAEIQNARIILVCLNAGLSSGEIKRRLRAV